MGVVGHCGDLGEASAGADGVGPDDEPAALHEGAADDSRSSGGFDGDRLPGHRGHVECCGAVGDGPVNGDPAAGADDYEVLYPDCAERNGLLFPVFEQLRFGDAEVADGFEDVGGAAAAAALEVPAGELEGDHAGGDVKVDRVCTGGGLAEPEPVPGGGGGVHEESPECPPERHDGAE